MKRTGLSALRGDLEMLEAETFEIQDYAETGDELTACTSCCSCTSSCTSCSGTSCCN